MIVLKFGGTSMADADAMARAAAITRTRLDRGAAVVVSAMAGVTNTLLEISERASGGELIVALRLVEGIRERHLAAVETLLGTGEEATELCGDVSAMCDELASLAEALSVLGHHTPRSQDAISAFGELLSSAIVVPAFRRLGLPARHVDARDVIVTDDLHTRATPLPDAIAREARRHVLPLVESGELPVLGGYVGGTAQRVTTTLGRGGSDYSAALLGAALDAEAIEIWTDVDGMLTGDPRVVAGARLIEHIRFDEAAELAAFGAKVLHPSTIAPAVKRGIPVFIYNSRRPEGRGTRITADAPKRALTAVAGKASVTVVKVRSPRMLLAHGVLRRIFEVFERNRVSIDVVATSEVSVSMTVDDPSHLDALLVELAPFGDVVIERNRAILSLVGSALGGGSRTMARALAALGDLRVHMISLSATEINLTLIVDADQLQPAMRAVHAEFFGHAAAGAEAVAAVPAAPGGSA
ncbi:MAG TPA: aspartate kinase [Gemmatimonadaceae bacterium]|nr:aspartate kinase [Gemmatimonadaceae bacterium]